jgi:Dolichyl-phosphate-mannose-protein mannosyltransferase
MRGGLALLSGAVTSAARSNLGRAFVERIDHSRLRWVLRRWEWFWIAAILLIAALAHGINMFDFPYQENDEAAYMSQAWAVLKLGELAPYTYWYDHAPLGWIQIAAWNILTGGFHTFGTSVDSGRVLMLVMQVTSTLVLYRIARNISGSVVAATLVSLAFALSAYGIYFHRRVLLDNIATLWMLLSILPLVSGRLTLSKVWFSAFALGVSVLSKEVTIVLVPVLTYLVFYRADRVHRWFATALWPAIVGCVVSTYVLMATLKGELLPAGTLEEFLAGTLPRVSLIGTLLFQASREGGSVLDADSAFWTYTSSWVRSEPLLVLAGSAAALISVLLIKRQRLAGVMGLATFSLRAFLARGGVVIDFYLVPLLPLLALNLGLVLNSATGLVSKPLRRYSRIASVISGSTKLAALALCLVLLVWGGYFHFSADPEEPFSMWTSSQAVAQRQATDG